MPKVIFTEISGKQHSVPIEPGYTLMQLAVDNGIPGIDAHCGGGCSCATCMVYVDGDWAEKLPPMNPLEEDMLEMALGRTESSRLACQIEMSADLDGLTVSVP